MKVQNKNRQWTLNIFMMFVASVFILPFVLLIISSLTDEVAVVQYGYSFFPKEFSLDAYSYLWDQRGQILHAYGITILVTVVGTVLGLTMTAMLAYPLSRKDMPLRNVLGFLVFFTIIFNGGLVPTYLVYTNLLDLKNTIWAQIIPYLLMNGFNVLLMRTFFTTTIPDSIIESARIDGAGEIRIFRSLVLPLSLPILATIGLLMATMYWNNWFNQMLFITDPGLYTIQNLLNRIMTDIQFLQNSDLASDASAAADLPSTTVRMAIAVIGILPILITYPFFTKYFRKGIAVGAVKG
ncbi:carbohydrate ABC transporter permease [Alkalihalobacillus sp. MEB130]|uniref:carbohydrate ABC transporter permease n=1 Tax=Alkalihalobacillus sp. MEB130 TaxID=2976704 RepID=UPI0028DDF18A|nr:carbohydrate ABC transporter permease [Alkalihalobacillus sp. MEB130]MDT8860206.1 carbohydrate ABC transporter permease [Alkalihalobacillus sp. MEB130]